MLDISLPNALSEIGSIETRHFIDGTYVAAHAGKTFSKPRPMDGQPGPEIAKGDADDIDAAVKAARRAFDSGIWSRTDPAHRKAVLLQFAQLIEENAEELAILETLDTGKPLRASREVDVASAARCIAWYAELADKRYDEIAPTGPNDLAQVRRVPLGVVGVITPWNYPLIVTSWKLGPALAAGNSVVHKPAEETSLSALRLAALGKEAGLPDGVLNVVAGFGEDAGDALVRHMDVDLIAFTGSTEVGRLIMANAANSNLKRVALELGGKSPLIAFDDADLDKVATSVAWGFAYNAGQTCHAPTRLVVHRDLIEPLAGRIKDVLDTIPVGQPWDPKAEVGALISAQHRDRIEGYVSRAIAAGGTLLFGTERILDETGGYYMAPGLVLTDNQSEIAQEEVFGPVLTVIPFDEEAEAIRIASDTPYGLAAAVFTENMDRAHRVSSALQAGTVWINTYDMANMATPFGGFGQSGFGRDRSTHALDKYSEFKTIWQHFAT